MVSAFKQTNANLFIDYFNRTVWLQKLHIFIFYSGGYWLNFTSTAEISGLTEFCSSLLLHLGQARKCMYRLLLDCMGTFQHNWWLCCFQHNHSWFQYLCWNNMHEVNNFSSQNGYEISLLCVLPPEVHFLCEEVGGEGGVGAFFGFSASSLHKIAWTHSIFIFDGRFTSNVMSVP